MTDRQRKSAYLVLLGAVLLLRFDALVDRLKEDDEQEDKETGDTREHHDRAGSVVRLVGLIVGTRAAHLQTESLEW